MRNLAVIAITFLVNYIQLQQQTQYYILSIGTSDEHSRKKLRIETKKNTEK